ncbi:MAG: ATP-binding protein [Candidatus Aminicenantes bacterium]|jgi:signal transduction histidine kinase
MLRRKKADSAHHRYIFVDRFEQDQGFRDYLAGLARVGMRNAGIFGVAGPLFHFFILGLLSGREIAWFCKPGGMKYAIADKLVIFSLGWIGLFLSKKTLSPQNARVIISLFLLVVCLAMTYDDIIRRDISHTVGFLILVMLIIVGVAPYRPWQVSLLGIAITLLFYLSIRFIPTIFGEPSLSPKSEHFTLLILATFVCTTITINLYLSRYLMYRSRQKQTALRQTIAQKAEELEELNLNLRRTQAQLVQSEKMAALGNLIKGVAHEINTPMGAVNSMHNTLYRALEKLKGITESRSLEDQNMRKDIDRIFRAVDDSKEVIQSGTDRVVNIVNRLRSFVHLDEAALKKVNIHEGIEDTLVLVQHELKDNIKVEKHYGEIPQITCYPRQLNQVFLNVLLNSIQAIEGGGHITITTYQKDKNVHLSFADDGVGIPKENINKVFDPGFTTKGVGIGTGMGLSICYKIIKNHGGEIKLESEFGKGSKFTIVLPLDLKDHLKA